MKEMDIYKTKDGQTGIVVHIDKETVWLTQKLMAELFQKNRTVITKHIHNVFKEGELDKKSNVQKMHTANSDKPTLFYNLEVIISVGYRVKSKQGILFRQWATQRLKDYLVKGYAINEKRLRQLKYNIKDLEQTVKLIHKYGTCPIGGTK